MRLDRIFIRLGPIMEQVYIMVTVELVTNGSHLIPMKDRSAKSLIRALETLQGIRGRLSTIIIVETKSHQVLKRDSNSGLTKFLLGNKAPFLVKAGVSIIIAPGKHH